MSNEMKLDFNDLITIIETSRANAQKAVNQELILMYWKVGEYLHNLTLNASFGDKVIDEVAKYIKEKNPTLKGFTKRGLYRMKQFHETYVDDEFVSTVLTQVSWSHHMLIISSCKTKEEREFYVYLSISEKYSYRELERQIDSMYFHRYMLSNESYVPTNKGQEIRSSILDTYVLEFLDLPKHFNESDLRHEIVGNLKEFILEFGKDFAFLGEEYKLIVGGQDFYIDLLFYHRKLKCLVPIELKTGKFKPEYIGQLNFYLEAMDRDVKKEYENPSVGILLCASKNDVVAEYALSKSMSQLMVSSYTLELPHKNVLENRLKEIAGIAYADKMADC